MLANYFGDNVKKVTGVDSVGRYGTIFITPNFVISKGKIEKNESFPIYNSKTPIMNYDFIDMPEEDCADVARFIIEKLLNFHSPYITIPLLGEVGRCPIISKIGGLRYITYHEGLTGVGKTMIQKAFLNFYFPISLGEKSSDNKKQAIATASDTPNSVQFHGHFIHDMPFIWDDFKGGVSKYEKQIIEVIQNYYDGAGKGRLDKEIRTRRAYAIRANLWCNGEQLPEKHRSALERMLIYRVEKDKLDLNLKNEIEAGLPMLRGITPHYIRWTQEKGPVKWKDGPFSSSHPRLTEYGIQNMTGLATILTYFKEKGWLKDGEYNELLVTGKVAIEKAIKLTQTSSESEGTVSTFIEGIREILHTTCVLGPEPRMNEEERRTFRTKICIGEDREDEGQVLIFPHKSVEQVSKLYQNKISISVRSLGRDLFEQKFLLESRSSGSPSVIKRVGEGGKALSVWVFDRTKLFGITEEEKEENENSLANNEKVEDELFDEPNNPNKMQDK
jgi:hypothetical protein